MSVEYCYECLERTDCCDCVNTTYKGVYGDYRRGYIQGYRDALAGKEEDI